MLKIIKADIRIYQTARPPTTKRDLLDLLITLLNTPIDLEHLINLSTLKNFKRLINLVIFNAKCVIIVSQRKKAEYD